METLRSIITSLTVIWPNEGKGLSLLKRLREAWTADIDDFHSAVFEFDPKIDDFHSAVFEFDPKIQQSKQQIECWCEKLTFARIRYVLQHIRRNLDDFSCYRANNIVPLKKQINLFKSKIVFLDESLKNIECCSYMKVVLQFLNFTRVFANKSVCLAFVDLFFQHLGTTLTNDFHILRDRLIFLFAFIIDPPCENAKEEDLIRNQVYALLNEDSYLLSFDEKKDDFSNKKMLYSDCLIKINIATDKIRQVYCGFFDSWIRLEVEKMEYIYFVSVHRELSSIEKHAQWADLVLDRLQLYKMELRFLRVFLLCFATWHDSDEEIKMRLNPMISSLQEIWRTYEENGLLVPRLYAICTGDIANWHPLSLELERKIHLSKLEIKKWCLDMFHLSFRCKSSTTYKILKFLDSILVNLHDLVNFKAGEIIPFKKQIETLEEKGVYGLLPFDETWLEVVNLLYLTEHVISSCINSWFVFDHPIWHHIAYLSHVFDNIEVVKTRLEKIKGNTMCNAICPPNSAGLSNVFAFCSVSQDHNTRRLLLDVLRDITGDGKRIVDMTDDDLAHQLWKCFGRQKYLIVMDDIWNASSWNG